MTMNTIINNPSIIFTIGPSTCDEFTLTKILSQNVSYVRFNMSHASHDEHRSRLLNVRKVAEQLNKQIKVFADLCGPKIRVSAMSADTIKINRGATITILYDEKRIPEVENSFAVSYKELYLYVAPHTKIALDDGKILLSVCHVDEKDIVCNVIQGGELVKEKGVNIVDVDLPISPFTEKDEKDVLFAIENNTDAVALSFVKKEEDILHLREFLKAHTSREIPIIAKIETRQALHNIQGILEATDMLMVARGDLGIEMSIEKIPLIQKELAYVANSKGVPVIVATEILKSMTKNPFPTRAEITDCIDALIDGASYLMLSDETTIGEYPVEAITVMSSVIHEFTENRKKYAAFEKQ